MLPVRLCFAAMCLAVTTIPAVGAQALQPEADSGMAVQPLEALVLKHINSIRTGQGLRPLAASTVLGNIARRFSRAMSDDKFFSHTDPQGRDGGDRVRAEGLCYLSFGENIAWNYNVPDPGATAIRTWMNSRGHRRNILDANFQASGVGVWRLGATYYFTQLFLQPYPGPCGE